MRAASVALAVTLTATLAAPSTSHGKGRPRPPKTVVTTTTTTLTPTEVSALHDTLCPQVMHYPTCATMIVTVADFGSTGWVGRSAPARNAVDYNTEYAMTAAGWGNVIAHEAGGHVDTWSELVARVGVAQTWTDYYDLNAAAVPWLEGRYRATFGVTRTFTETEAKEAWLDCAGAVSNGFRGHYLTRFGVTDQGAFCEGHAAVLETVIGAP